jgi:hypothetical protein
MTTPKALANQLRNLLNLLLESEIAIIANPVVEEHFGHRTRVTWRSRRPTIGMLSSSAFATVSEYRNFIDSEMYSAILFDGGMIQISYDYSGSDLIGHRLCYYPCPFDMDPALLRTEPLADLIDIYKDNRETATNLRSPCRFDYDEQNAESDHPAVHMHIIRANCRWAVSGPVSVGHFIRFVFRHFYPDIWSVHPFLRKWPQERAGRRMIGRLDELDLHVTCGQH